MEVAFFFFFSIIIKDIRYTCTYMHHFYKNDWKSIIYGGHYIAFARGNWVSLELHIMIFLHRPC